MDNALGALGAEPTFLIQCGVTADGQPVIITASENADFSQPVIIASPDSLGDQDMMSAQGHPIIITNPSDMTDHGQSLIITPSDTLTQAGQVLTNTQGDFTDHATLAASHDSHIEVDNMVASNELHPSEALDLGDGSLPHVIMADMTGESSLDMAEEEDPANSNDNLHVHLVDQNHHATADELCEQQSNEAGLVEGVATDGEAVLLDMGGGAPGSLLAGDVVSSQLSGHVDIQCEVEADMCESEVEQPLLGDEETLEEVDAECVGDEDAMVTVPVLLGQGQGQELTSDLTHFLATINGQQVIILAPSAAGEAGSQLTDPTILQQLGLTVGQTDEWTEDGEESHDATPEQIKPQPIAVVSMDGEHVGLVDPSDAKEELEDGMMDEAEVPVECIEATGLQTIKVENCVETKAEPLGSAVSRIVAPPVGVGQTVTVADHQQAYVQQDVGSAPVYILSVPGDGGQLGLVMQEPPAKRRKTVNGAVSKPATRKSNSKSHVTQAWFTTKDDKVALHSEGHDWKQGQWTKEEVEVLNNNIAAYCAERNITDATEIIFEFSKEERKDFYRTIARGLQRPLFSVYRRVIRMYDRTNHIGKYTPEEIDRLKELRERHGSDWATIGAALGRSASSVKDRCRLMRDTCNSGKWLPEEERRLAEAVYALSGASPGESVTNGLSWAAVAERVVTRSEKQCRTKWLNYLNWKQCGGTEWTRADDLLLIDKLSVCGATDESHVDWNDMSDNWPSARSPQWLRGKWWTLKRHVVDYQNLQLPQLLMALQRIHQPKILMKAQPVAVASQLRGDMSQLNLISQPVIIPMEVPQGAAVTSTAYVTSGQASDDGVAVTTGLEVVGGYGGQGAFLITQPHANPTVSYMADGNISTDHIIVHTLPVAQDGSGKVCFNAEDLANLKLQTHITQSQHDLESFNPSEKDESTAAMSPSHLHDNGTLTTQHIMLPDEHNYDTQVISGSDVASEVTPSDLEAHVTLTSQVLSSDGSDAQHYVQVDSTTGDLIQNITSFSDPMLPSDGTDLICSASDIETDKAAIVLDDGVHESDAPS